MTHNLDNRITRLERRVPKVSSPLYHLVYALEGENDRQAIEACIAPGELRPNPAYIVVRRNGEALMLTWLDREYNVEKHEVMMPRVGEPPNNPYCKDGSVHPSWYYSRLCDGMKRRECDG